MPQRLSTPMALHIGESRITGAAVFARLASRLGRPADRPPRCGDVCEPRATDML
ncbi:protein of unassigned function [Methylobacterium oryzae CBMB20]|uniref:Protein of unassigned function n=1 Tax=Methylobacterium oryzae CBMB20 TaxID=693986 RepID=A0A089QGF0_9HYPH|nr:protein of unassigned function [Methylobacterium oryzae CBMB20]